MKITEVTCLSHVIWLTQQKEFNESIKSIKYSEPAFNHEGMNGYIKTLVEIEVGATKLEKFSKVFEAWYYLDNNTRSNLYSIALNGKKVCNE